MEGPDRVERIDLPRCEHPAERWPAVGEGSGRAVILVPGSQGIDEPVRAVARRFQEAGATVLVPELRGADGKAIPDREVTRVLHRAQEALCADPTVQPGRMVCCGVGDGVAPALLYACQARGLSGVLLLLGSVSYPELDERHPTQPLEMTLGLECPLLAVFSADDGSVPAAEIEDLRARLDAFSKPYRIEILPGVSLGSLDPTVKGYAGVPVEPFWAVILGFLQQSP